MFVMCVACGACLPGCLQVLRLPPYRKHFSFAGQHRLLNPLRTMGAVAWCLLLCQRSASTIPSAVFHMSCIGLPCRCLVYNLSSRSAPFVAATAPSSAVCCSHCLVTECGRWESTALTHMSFACPAFTSPAGAWRCINIAGQRRLLQPLLTGVKVWHLQPGTSCCTARSTEWAIYFFSCLAGAWRAITVARQRRLLQPLLITGVKVWHLRSGSSCYTTRIAPSGQPLSLHALQGFDVLSDWPPDRVSAICCSRCILQSVADEDQQHSTPAFAFRLPCRCLAVCHNRRSAPLAGATAYHWCQSVALAAWQQLLHRAPVLGCCLSAAFWR
jgi:hypothetical protein